LSDFILLSALFNYCIHSKNSQLLYSKIRTGGVFYVSNVFL